MLRILCLGDSYTIGEGVPPADNWPHQLQRALLAQGLSMEEPCIIARTGWTGAELEQALQAAALTEDPYDLVTLLIGVNDQYRGYPLNSLGAVYTRLLDKAIALTGGSAARVLALSIPDWGVTPFAGNRDGQRIAQEIDAFNLVEAEMCKERGSDWIDITPMTRKLSIQSDMLVADQLHPSGLQYANWVEKILSMVTSRLGGGQSV